MKRFLIKLYMTVAAVILLAVSACALSNYTTSEAGIAFIKHYEGFSAFRFWDYSQYSIGYGTSCRASDYPDGISVAEADQLLRNRLWQLEPLLDAFIQKYNLSFTQSNYDALMSFTYNLGAAWMNGNSRLVKLLTSGEPFGPSDFASAMSVWCHTSHGINTGLITRRVAETKMFLHGDYSGTNSTSYYYVIFDANGGEVASDIYFFPADSFYGKLQTPTKLPDSENRHFVGWFKSDGTQITPTTTVTEDCTVVAHWSQYQKSCDVFSDVRKTDWFCTYLDDIYNAGIMSGYQDGTFRPNNFVTLAEALKLILTACGMSPQDTVDQSHWASGWRLRAELEGIMSFEEMSSLDAPVSREKVAEIASKALHLSTQELPESVYKDTSTTSALALYSAKIMEGKLNTDGTRSFLPNDSISRAEICAVIYRIFHYLG